MAAAAALAVAYVDRALFDADRFADRAAAALRDDRVASALAERIADRVVARQEDLLTARPLVQSVTEGIVRGSVFGSLFRGAVRDVHRAVIDGDADTVTLTVQDIGTVLGEALRAVRPAIAERVAAREDVTVLRRDVGEVSAGLARAAERVDRLSLILLAVALALAVAAVVAVADRREALRRLGAAVAVAGVLVALLTIAARAVLVASADDPDDALVVAGLWDAFAAGLTTAAVGLALCGAVVAAAAAAWLRPVPLAATVARLTAALTRDPEREWVQVVRGAGLVLAGALAVADPSAAARALLTVAGVLLVFAGVNALLGAIPRPAREARAARETRGPGARLRPAAVVVLAALLIGVVGAGVLASGAATVPQQATGRCNGSAALCDRPLTDVVLAATHNSMSVPDAGWYAAEQDDAIAAQLEDGVRGLLIDTHYGERLGNGRVRTVIDRGAKAADAVSPEAGRAALRLRERLGFRGEGERGMYLCHTFCELGWTPLADALDVLHAFLVTHPEEVVVVINQDAVTPTDFVGAMRDAGLDRLAFTPPDDGRWPTLGEMIRRDRRLLVLAEEEGGAAPWYRTAYDGLVEETPYDFPSVRALTGRAGLSASCRPNRGTAGAPFFLLNHWVATAPLPLPRDAAVVNATDRLLGRVTACERERGRRPNLLAVNFYRRGDVMDVVSELNRRSAFPHHAGP